LQLDEFSPTTADEYTLPNGDVLKLPIHYTDATQINAMFTAPVARVRELLPSRMLRPVQLAPGRAIVEIAAWEYPTVTQADGTPFPPYRELIVAIPVLYEPRIGVPLLPLLAPTRFKSLGAYISHMAVTTEEARDGGIAIWGFPKFAAEIDFVDSDNARGMRVSAGGKDVLNFEVEKVSTHPKREDFQLYTFKNGEILRTVVRTRGEYGNASRGGRASYTLGNHPVADELRRLKMGRVALQRGYATRVELYLPLPSERLVAARTVGDVAVPVGR
jgi:hypothetical protein